MSLRQILHDHPLWVLFGIVLFGALSYVLTAFIGTVIVAVFVYYAARPIYRRLEARMGHPTPAAAVSIVALVLPALLLVGYAFLIVSRELRAVTDQFAFSPADLGLSPELYNRLTDPRTLLSSDFSQLMSGDLARSVVDSLASFAQTATALGVVVINLLAMVVIAFYLLRDDHRLARWVRESFDSEDGLATEFGRAVDRDLSSIFFGNILNAIITGTIAVIVYSLLNVFAPDGAAIPAAALVGLLAGVASLIPVIGMKVVYVPVALYMAVRGVVMAGGESLWFVIVFAAVSVVVIDLIPDIILRPYVSGKNIHIGLLMLAYILGPLFFGWYGLFLMPALLVVAVQFARIVVPALGAESSNGRPATPAPEPTAGAGGRTQPIPAAEPPADAGHSANVDDSVAAGDPADTDNSGDDGDADNDLST